VRIAADTAAGIVSALAQIPKFDFGISAGAFAAFIAATGAAQAALVASQPLPQFFKGKSPDDNYEGWATVNELPGQKEVKIDQYGGVTAYKAGMQLDYVKKDDIIVPSMSTFNREIKNPDSDVFKRLSRQIDVETNERVYFIKSQESSIDTKGIESVMERVMMKYANRPINTIVKVENPDNYSGY
jgi:hypothetical protein